MIFVKGCNGSLVAHPNVHGVRLAAYNAQACQCRNGYRKSITCKYRPYSNIDDFIFAFCTWGNLEPHRRKRCSQVHLARVHRRFVVANCRFDGISSKPRVCLFRGVLKRIRQSASAVLQALRSNHPVSLRLDSQLLWGQFLLKNNICVCSPASPRPFGVTFMDTFLSPSFASR